MFFVSPVQAIHMEFVGLDLECRLDVERQALYTQHVMIGYNRNAITQA